MKQHKPAHTWIRPIHAAFVPGNSTPVLDQAARSLLDEMQRMGHCVQSAPDCNTEVILTIACFDEPLSWRNALLFSARRRYGLQHTPVIYTLMQVTYVEFDRVMSHLHSALQKHPIQPRDFTFAGLAPDAWKVLVEQGERGGPILALQRCLQAQAKCLRIILFVGDEEPGLAYHFDLVGAYPKSVAGKDFYTDITRRIATAVSAREVPVIQAADEIVPGTSWESNDAVRAMQAASQEFGKRNFFTSMIRIADLIGVRSVSDAVASQYSEGCFGTWCPELNALIVTATGSAHPVNKSLITHAHLAAVKGNHQAIYAMKIDGKPCQTPSSESHEMVEMDMVLPKIRLPGSGEAPVSRSKLHGHRGIAAYHPEMVEYVPMAEPYFHYLVSCGTYPQAHGIVDAFLNSSTLNNPDDPRQIVFTVLPGHGIFIVEKWCANKAPFQVIWEYIDKGYLEISKEIPQGVMGYVLSPDGRMHLMQPAV